MTTFRLDEAHLPGAPWSALTTAADRPRTWGLGRTTTVTAAVGAGIVGGVLFAFSTFVMPALRSVDARSGLVSMQAINRDAPNPLFMTVLMGTAALSVALGIWSFVGDHPARTSLRVACVLYLATIAITAGYHVPHNDALALLSPDSPHAAASWRHYASGWTLLNHVRTATSIGACVAFVRAAMA